MDELEIEFRDPGVELCRPTFPLDEQLLHSLFGFALENHLLNKGAILADLLSSSC